MSVVIRKSEGNYYKGLSPIGPRFGATKEEACEFADEIAASKAMSHFAFSDCEIEVLKRKD